MTNGLLIHSVAPYLVYRIMKFTHQHKYYVGEQTGLEKNEVFILLTLFLDVGGIFFFSVSFHCYILFVCLFSSPQKNFRKA